MKKIVLIIIVFLIAILSGCSTNRSTVDVARDVLYCFDNDDVESLKKLFCAATLSTTDNLDTQIEEAFDFYEGKCVSYGFINSPSQKSVRNGKTVSLKNNPLISYIKTDSGKEYAIKVYMYCINVNYPEKVGISKISVYTYNNEYELVLDAEIGELLD